MNRFAGRRDKLRKPINEKGAEALLVSNESNVTYLTGFTGDSSYLLVTDDGESLISDFRYITQIAEQCPGVDVHIRKSGVKMPEAVERLVKRARIRRLAVEGESISLAESQRLQDLAPNVEWITTEGLVERLREVKDKDEIAAIRRAVRCAERAFDVMRASLDRRHTEKQTADRLEHAMRQFGARDRAFEPIIAVGANAALPHAQPGDRRIEEAELLLVDWGARYGLYRSDLTRVLLTGRITSKLRRVFDVVRKAQQRAIAAIKPGATGAEVDQAARDVIAKAGFGKRFGHSLGHGVGLDIHEGPTLSAINDKPLRAGMVVTVEPGVYLPGWGGVRLEDDVLVTRNGAERLSRLPNDLDSMIVSW